MASGINERATFTHRDHRRRGTHDIHAQKLVEQCGFLKSVNYNVFLTMMGMMKAGFKGIAALFLISSSRKCY